MARSKELALYYRTLAELLGAGVPVTGALAHAGELLRGARGLDAHVERGATLTQTLATAPAVFPQSHLRLIAAGEASGRVESVLKLLADFVEKTGEMRRKVLSGMLMPAALFHFAAVIAPVPAWFGGGSTSGYLASALTPIATVWLVVAAGVVLVPRLPAEWSDGALRRLPWFRDAWRELNLWWFIGGMEMLVNAGVGVVAGLRNCAEASRSPRLAAVLREAADTAEVRGEPVSVALDASGEFPKDVMARWKTGERSGYLDGVLAQLGRDYAARTAVRLEALAEWAPRIVYMLAAMYVAAQILRLGARQLAA